MTINSITANKKSFHTVVFKDGLNIIVAKQKEPVSINTYNGVGKSLLLHIAHFCFGADSISEFKKELPGWVFRLDFTHEGKKHYVERSTDNQGKTIIDGKEFKHKEGNNTLSEIIFGVDSLPDKVSWRSLISRYIRRFRGSYTSFDTFIPKEKDYNKLLNNCYLLGIDTDLIIRKKEIKDRLDSNLNSRDSIKKDDTFRKYFLGDNDPVIAASSLKDEISVIEKAISSFQVSENYHEIQSEADEISRKKDQLESDCFFFKRRIDNINQSLSQHIANNDFHLMELYGEAKVGSPEMVKKSLKEIEVFHNNLISSRDLRLRKQLEQQEKELREKEIQIKALGDKMDSLLLYLNTHGALEEYVALTRKLSDSKQELSKIEAFQQLQKEFEDTYRNIRSEFINLETEAAKYLEDNSEFIESLSSQFRSYAKEFYPGKVSGLSITNNTGENCLRYSMDAKIQDDSSDGINSVKVFCFDMLLLLSPIAHIDFVFHDSRLFPDMDPRQREILFRIANRICTNDYKQYICTINEEQVKMLREQMDEKEFKTLISDNIRLELTDDSPESKLLGIQVDLKLD